MIEYRIFYFYEKFYSIAILSQENDFTKIDSRKNENDKGSRLVPIEIEQEIKDKIIDLMKELDLIIGSIDMMLS